MLWTVSSILRTILFTAEPGQATMQVTYVTYFIILQVYNIHLQKDLYKSCVMCSVVSVGILLLLASLKNISNPWFWLWMV